MLGIGSGLLHMGTGDLSVAFWDRVELPSDESRPWADVNATSGVAAVVGGDCTGASQRVGMVAFRGSVNASPGRTTDPARAASASDASHVDPRGDRDGVRYGRGDIDRKATMLRDFELEPSERFWNY